MWSEHSTKATTSGARSADILTDPRVRRTTLAGISEGEREAARGLAKRLRRYGLNPDGSIADEDPGA